MKSLVTVVIPAILLVALVLFGPNDTAIPIVDIDILDNDVTGSGAHNSSAITTIAITITGTLNE